MNLEFVPLLQMQRDLQGLPRTPARFQEYLRKLTPDRATVDLPPLAIFNPMAREHVTAILDELLAMDAEGIAANTVAEVSVQLAKEPGDFKAGLVVADDQKGGWTNRYDCEFNLRFGATTANASRLPRWSKHRWLTFVLWGSEPAKERAVREAVRMAIHRAVYVGHHGQARTLLDMLAQEGHVMAAAGCTGPLLNEADLSHTREVLNGFLEDGDKRTAIECLFGDPAGQTLGFTPHGLSLWAGLALALNDARNRQLIGVDGG